MWPNILQRPMKVPECSRCSAFNISVDRRPSKLGVTLNPKGGGSGGSLSLSKFTINFVPRLSARLTSLGRLALGPPAPGLGPQLWAAVFVHCMALGPPDAMLWATALSSAVFGQFVWGAALSPPRCCFGARLHVGQDRSRQQYR